MVAKSGSGTDDRADRAFSAESVGEAIKDLLGRRPQREVAEKSAMTESSFSRFLTGRSLRGVEKLERVLPVLGVDWNELMRRAGSRVAPAVGEPSPAAASGLAGEVDLIRMVRALLDQVEALRRELGRREGGPTGAPPSRPPSPGR